MTRVEFSVLWLVGLVYFFISSPAGMTPFPVAAGWVIIGTTLFALVVLGRRFPLFGLFLLMTITSLTSRGRRRRWW
jgi:hypothetical protein